MILLGILADLSNAVICIASILPLISNLFGLFTKFLGIDSSFPNTFGINIIFYQSFLATR